MCYLLQQMQVVLHAELSCVTVGFRDISPFLGFQTNFHQRALTNHTDCQAMGPVLTNQRVLFFSDNTAVVAVINRQTASDPHLMCLADRAWGDYLRPAFVCSEFLNSLAGTVLVQS